MSVQWIMPNGEVVPVPQDVVSQSREAEQAFYDLQLVRIEAELADAAPKTEE